MPDPSQTIVEAKRHHQAGNLHAAEQLFRQALEMDPDRAETWYYLGVLHSQQRRFEEAIEYLGRATSIDPGQPVYLYALANAFLERGDYDEAASRYRRAIRLHNDFPDAHNNLGIALERSGKMGEAVKSYREAVRLRPGNVSSLVNLGNAHRGAGELDEAEEWFRKAIEIDPAIAEAHNNLGNILQQRGELDEAIRHFTEAIDLRPGYAAAYNNLGSACKAKNEHDRAVESFRRARELAPKVALFALNLGNTLLDVNRTEEAIDQYRQALELDPNLLEARWHQRLALPVLYEREEEIPEWRARFREGLSQLIEETPITAESAAAALKAAGSMTNFFLAYQAGDDLAHQRQYGEFVHRIAAASFPKWARPRPMHKPGKDGRIRIGFASAYFRYHSGARWVLAFIRDGDHQKFKFYCYHIGLTCDATTEQFRAACDEWRHIPGDLEAVCQRMASDRPHVLIYTDIGMNAQTTQMAALRLAPVQCTAWGHPMTSGLPTIDYYNSSDLMEPPEADAYYTETLIRLPNLGICYPRPVMPAEAKTREQFGLPPVGEAVVYLSCQSLYKYLPQHDHVFVDIARRVPGARFVFTSARSRAVTEQFRRRVHRAFDEAGLDPQRSSRILPRLDPTTDFFSLLLAGDVFLDTLDWSGGNTTLEALAAGRPVVTTPGRFMRGRHACAMLRMIGLEEMIAPDKDGYVAIAARLGLDEDYRRSVADQVRQSSDRLFDDPAPVEALQQHLERWTSPGAG